MAIVPRRMTAQIEGDFVVFLIGTRLNQWWRLDQFMWIGGAMNGMIAELQARPESGFLGFEGGASWPPMMVQYWRSSEQLMAYARSRDTTHYPAWVKFNRDLAKHRAIGIWHETYVVRAGDYECVYNNMPPYGLGKIAQALAAEGRHATAKGRLGQTDGSDAPILPDGREVS